MRNICLGRYIAASKKLFLIANGRGGDAQIVANLLLNAYDQDEWGYDLSPVVVSDEKVAGLIKEVIEYFNVSKISPHHIFVNGEAKIVALREKWPQLCTV